MSICVVIPSARAENLIQCVQSIIRYEPLLPTSSIIVVDDGAREASEAILPPVTWISGVKPFVFARNINLGIAAAGTADVFLLNDDTQLQTPFGLTGLSDQMRRRLDVGLCSAAIVGLVCNPEQSARLGLAFRPDPYQQLAFVAVYVPRHVIDRVGLLDERFVGYGYDDFDYCHRVSLAGFTMAIWDGCVVEHERHTAQSVYRSRSDWPDIFQQNHAIYQAKWPPS